jgi:hypothetical protein
MKPSIVRNASHQLSPAASAQQGLASVPQYRSTAVPQLASEATGRSSSFSLPRTAAAANLSLGPRRVLSLNNIGKKVPALHELIGLERAQALDVQFGSLQPPRTIDKEGYLLGLKPTERDEEDRPLTHKKRLKIPNSVDSSFSWSSAEVKEKVDLEALKRGDRLYLWAVSSLGHLFVGEEEKLGVDPKTDKQLVRAHPMLVGGGPARICGELGYDALDDYFLVIDKSGRYSRCEDRSPAHLDEATLLFEQSGLRVKAQKHITERAAEPLVLRTLDPDFRSALNLDDSSSPELPDAYAVTRPEPTSTANEFLGSSLPEPAWPKPVETANLRTWLHLSQHWQKRGCSLLHAGESNQLG